MAKHTQSADVTFHALCAMTGSRRFALTGDAAVSAASWQDIIALASRHRVEGLLARGFAEGMIEAPEQVRKHFSNCARTQALAALGSAKALEDVAHALDRRQIRFVLLKGLDVADRYYSSWADRHSIDIDLLVAESDLHQAELAVSELGFRSRARQRIPEHCFPLANRLRADWELERESDDVSVELHHRLFTNPHLLSIPFAELHRRTRPLRLGSTTVRVLEPDILLNYLVVHGAKHGWFRLKWLADLDRLLPAMSDVEYQQAVDFAVQTGCGRLFATSLSLLHGIYGTAPARTLDPQLAGEVDETLLRLMTAHLLRSEVRTSYRLQDFRHWADNIRLDFTLRHTWQYRLRQAELFLIDQRDIEALRLSSRWRPLYFFLGPPAKILRSIARSVRP